MTDPARPVMLVSRPARGIPPVTGTATGFAAALDDLAAADGPLAADAERASSYRYSRGDYLVQVRREGSDTYLFDIPALRQAGVRLADLTDRLAGVEWILHDGSQDLPSFRDLGLRIPSLFDTEFAARLLGLSHPGLSHCTEHFLGVSLAKEHAAADWSYRPLPLDWRNYAALDVELLVQLRHAMVAELKAQGKLAWAREEFAAVLAKGMAAPLPDPEPWRHTSHITVLSADRRGLGRRARSVGRPRQARPETGHLALLLLRDEDMVEAAPETAQQVAVPRNSVTERVRMDTGTDQDAMFARYISVQKVNPNVWRRAISHALHLPETALPWPRSRRRGRDVHAWSMKF